MKIKKRRRRRESQHDEGKKKQQEQEQRHRSSVDEKKKKAVEGKGMVSGTSFAKRGLGIFHLRDIFYRHECVRRGTRRRKCVGSVVSRKRGVVWRGRE